MIMFYDYIFLVSVITDKPNKLGKHYLDRDEALLQTLQSKLNNTQQTTQTNVQQTQRPQDTLKETQLRMSNAIIHFYVGESLLSVHKTPLEKYKFPQTSAQQIGWYSAEIHKIPPTKFAFAKKSCEETAYADVLIKSSTKTGGGGNDKKGGASPAKADKK